MADDARILNLYLPHHLRDGCNVGQTNILSQITAALPGWIFRDHPEEEGVLPPARPGYSLTHMQEPWDSATLSLRRTYWYPFWRISPTNARWNFAVAAKTPDYSAIPPVRAKGFHSRLRERVLEGRTPRRDGFVFMPLQGRLLQHRSFQSMSPAEMIQATLDLQPLPIRATLHPGEVYTPPEIQMLETFAQNPRFDLVTAPAADLIAACDYVVCQNSSLALHAMVAGKGAVLFAGIDFQHQAGSVLRDGLTQAFIIGRAPPENMRNYLWWFFKDEAIDAQSHDAPARIAALLEDAGWPV